MAVVHAPAISTQALCNSSLSDPTAHGHLLLVERVLLRAFEVGGSAFMATCYGGWSTAT